MPDFLRRLDPQPLIFFGTLFLIVGILSFASSVLIPISLAILLSLLLSPLVRLVQRYGLKRIPAVVAVTTVAFIFLAVLIYALLTQFFSIAQNAKHYEKIIAKKITAMRGGGSVIDDVLDIPQKVSKEIEKASEDRKQEPGKVEDAVGSIPPIPVIIRTDPMEILSFYFSTAQEVVRIVAAMGLVVVLVIVMLIFREEMRDRLIRLTGCNRLTVTTRALDEASQRISNYILRKSIVNGIFGAVIGVGLFLIGIPFALMWGFLLAVLRFIPGLGIWLSAVPPLALAVIGFEYWWPVALVLTLYVIGEMIAINIVEPHFLGTQIGLMPVATIVSLSFWTWLWGPVGLLLAIPITVCIAVLGKYVPQLSFLSILLSDQPAMDSTLRYYQRLLANDEDEAIEIVDEFVKENGTQRVYDELLVAALSHSRRDVAAGELEEANLDFFFKTTADILGDLHLSPSEQSSRENLPEALADKRLIGCPIGDTGDQLALRMVGQMLDKRGLQFNVGRANGLASEMIEWIQEQRPDVLCLACIAPGGLPQTRLVCKRVRKQFPKTKIIVARLGFTVDFDKDKDTLQESGADAVCDSIEGTTLQLIKAAQQLEYEHEAAAEPVAQ